MIEKRKKKEKDNGKDSNHIRYSCKCGSHIRMFHATKNDFNYRIFDIDPIEKKKIMFQDEAGNNIISLGILTDKNIRADVYADIITVEDIEIKAN